LEGDLLLTDRHTQNNKDQGRRPVTRRRERETEKKSARDSEREGTAEAETGRAEGQAEMKAERGRKPDTQDMLEEHRSWLQDMYGRLRVHILNFDRCDDNKFIHGDIILGYY
jgi:hypothetical protein